MVDGGDQVKRRTSRRFRLQTNPVVFTVSVLVILAFLVAGIAATDHLHRLFETVQDGIATYLGWYYILLVGAFLVFVVWLGASRFGRIRLGPPDSRPQYRYFTWFAMLFTVGRIDAPKIQRVFWSVLEGAVAGVLLLAGAGGLLALQTAAITTALPFSLVMIAMCYGLVRALYADHHQWPLDSVTLVKPDHERVPTFEEPERDGVPGPP